MIVKNLELKNYFDFLGEDDRNPSVDVYLPYDSLDREDYKRPCLVICPGGGYAFCSSREAEPIALKFLPEGFNVFVLWYSVAPHKFPTQIREVAALMELIYNNAKEWNCDTDKISIMGFSAGAHLAGHYSTMFDCEEVRELFPASKAPKASILCYPVISAKEGKCHVGSFENLVGHYPLNDEEMKKFKSESRIRKDCIPQLIDYEYKTIKVESKKEVFKRILKMFLITRIVLVIFLIVFFAFTLSISTKPVKLNFIIFFFLVFCDNLCNNWMSHNI